VKVSKEQLYKDVDSLLSEVDSIPLEAADRRRLHGLISDLERHIDAGEGDNEHFELVDTMEEFAARLEADHPAFTGILRRVMNALGSMGV
jgi:hypothetical protein